MFAIRIIALLAVLFALGCSYEPSGQKEKNEGYQYEFGQWPSAGIHVTHAKLAGIRDFERNWLRIEMRDDPQSFLLARGFSKAKAGADVLSSEIWDSTPRWWNPEPEAEFDFYECQKWAPLHGLQWAKAYVAVSRSTRVLYFVCERGG